MIFLDEIGSEEEIGLINEIKKLASDLGISKEEAFKIFRILLNVF